MRAHGDSEQRDRHNKTRHRAKSATDDTPNNSGPRNNAACNPAKKTSRHAGSRIKPRVVNRSWRKRKKQTKNATHKCPRQNSIGEAITQQTTKQPRQTTHYSCYKQTD